MRMQGHPQQAGGLFASANPPPVVQFHRHEGRPSRPSGAQARARVLLVMCANPSTPAPRCVQHRAPARCMPARGAQCRWRAGFARVRGSCASCGGDRKRPPALPVAPKPACARLRGELALPSLGACVGGSVLEDPALRARGRLARERAHTSSAAPPHHPPSRAPPTLHTTPHPGPTIGLQATTLTPPCRLLPAPRPSPLQRRGLRRRPGRGPLQPPRRVRRRGRQGRLLHLEGALRGRRAGPAASSRCLPPPASPAATLSERGGSAPDGLRWPHKSLPGSACP